MKKNLSKFAISMIATAAIAGGILLAGAQNAPLSTTTNDVVNTQAVEPTLYEGRGFGMMGQDSDGNWSMRGNFKNLDGNSKDLSMLKNILPAFILGFIGVGIISMIIVLLCIAFWIWMLVDAIKNDIEYKPLWILVLGLMGIIGAIVYYFAVKKNPSAYYEECGCGCNCEDENGTCASCDGKDCKCKSETEVK